MINSQLPVLEAVYSAIKSAGVPSLNKTVFVCVQHLLYTSVNLFEVLIRLGANPNHIFLIGKHYSTCPNVAEKLQSMGIQLQGLTPLKRLGEYTSVFSQDVSTMWQRVQQYIPEQDIEAVMVLDDGGRCLEFITPDIFGDLPVIGIEQTTAGLFNPNVLNLPTPFIDVAVCAAKVHLESHLIVEAIFNKLENSFPIQRKNLRCGVVGAGVIGKAVINLLVSWGCRVYLYEQNSANNNVISAVTYCNSVEELLTQVDYVFGCTGRDITKGLEFNTVIRRDKFFISCTSEDKEFLSLLLFIQAHHNAHSFDPLKDVHYQLPNGANVCLIKGGFPINFDDSGVSVSAEKIQLTRALLLAALIQGISSLAYLKNAKIKGRLMLHPEAQKFIAQYWFKFNSVSSNLIERFNDTEWIAAHSGGQFHEYAYMQQCFASLADVVVEK